MVIIVGIVRKGQVMSIQGHWVIYFPLRLFVAKYLETTFFLFRVVLQEQET